MSTIKTDEGMCEQAGCFQRSLVGLQGRWYCLTHFQSRLKKMREDLTKINELIERAT